MRSFLDGHATFFSSATMFLNASEMRPGRATIQFFARVKKPGFSVFFAPLFSDISFTSLSVLSRELAGFLVNRVLLAETAVLAHFDTVRVVALILHRVVIALLALRAGQRDLHAHTSSSHTRHLLLKKRTSSVRQTCLHIVHPAAMLVNRFLQVFLNTSGLLLFSPVFSVFLCFLIPTPEKIQIKQAPARRVEACMRHFISASTPSAYRVCSSACAIIM